MVKGAQFCWKRNPATRVKSSGIRFSKKRRSAPTASAKPPSTPPATRRAGRQSTNASRSPALHPASRQRPRAAASSVTASHDGELRARERRPAGRQPGEQWPAAGEGEQFDQHEEEAEGCGVGVGEDEVEESAGEADRGQHGGGEGGRERLDPAASQRVEHSQNRPGLQVAEYEGDREARTEQLEGQRERVDAGRPVEVANVLVGEVTVMLR